MDQNVVVDVSLDAVLSSVPAGVVLNGSSGSSDGARQLEDSAQFYVQEDVSTALVLMVTCQLLITL